MSNNDTPNLRFRVIEMTPELAKKYLAKNTSNRNVRPKKVDEYVTMMRKGYWHLTSEGISLDPDGNLLDGQHRLLAVIEYGKPVQMTVCTGLPPGTQQYMDSGIPRRVADNLKMFDGEKSASQLVAMSRAITLFENGQWEPVLLDDARKMLRRYRQQIEWMQGLPSKQLPRTAYFFAPLAWIHKHGWHTEAELFADELATLEGLTRGSPVIALYKALDRVKTVGGGARRSIATSMLTFAALRAYMEEEQVTARNIHANTVGFDYFNVLVKDIDTKKRRRGDTCRWRHGCNFKSVNGTGRDGRCWIHQHFTLKRSSGND